MYIFWKTGNTHGYSSFQCKTAVLVRRSSDTHDSPGNLLCRRNILDFLLNHYKFVTIQPGNQIYLAHHGTESIADLSYHFVTHQMTILIIKKFEIIQIYQKNCKFQLFNDSRMHSRLQRVFKHETIGQMRQWIVMRGKFEVLLLHLDLS